MFKDILTKEFLIEEYSNKKRFKKEIARDIGCTVKTINNYLVKHNIPPNKRRSHYKTNLVGNVYDRLTVISRADNDQFNKTRWLCQCACGNMCEVNASSLKRNLTSSCGCFKSEKAFRGYKDISYTYFRRLKQSAVNRNFSFELSIEDIWSQYQQQDKICALSGVPIHFCRDQGNQPEKQNASVDRINSRIGYNKNNIQIVHKTVNFMKLWVDNDEFIAWCQLISNNHEENYEVSQENLLRPVARKI